MVSYTWVQWNRLDNSKTIANIRNNDTSPCTLLLAAVTAIGPRQTGGSHFVEIIYRIKYNSLNMMHTPVSGQYVSDAYVRVSFNTRALYPIRLGARQRRTSGEYFNYKL